MTRILWVGFHDIAKATAGAPPCHNPRLDTALGNDDAYAFVVLLVVAPVRAACVRCGSVRATGAASGVSRHAGWRVHASGVWAAAVVRAACEGSRGTGRQGQRGRYQPVRPDADRGGGHGSTRLRTRRVGAHRCGCAGISARLLEARPGDYDVQAVLDVDHDYNYSGRGAGDLVSDVTAVPFDSGASVPTLRLTRALTDAPQPWKVPEQVPAKQREQLTKRMQAAQPHSRALDFVSPALSAFWGRPIHVRGWVLLPPGYRKNANAHYPAVYFTHGFGGELAYLTSKAADVWSDMADG